MSTNTNPALMTTTDLRATIEARLLAGESAETIADDLRLDVTTDGETVILDGWIADDGNCEVEFPYADSGREAAEEYVSDGDWGDDSSTSWVDVHAWRIGLQLGDDGEVEEIRVDEETHTIAINPREPACADGHEHDWRSPHSVVGGIKDNPGVWGKGGGVVITEVCRHCGRYRDTDTWAQNPQTGEQGLCSVEYRDADEGSLVWVATEAAGEVIDALADLYDLSDANVRDGQIRFGIALDDADDDDEAEERLDEIRALLPAGWEVDWTGNGVGDESDVVITRVR